jgi:signal transduction histidine kinase/CheY-like chemotaxis protein
MSIIERQRLISDSPNEATQFLYEKNGKTITLEIKSVKIKAPGRNNMIEYIIEDLSFTKDLEEAKAKQRCFQILVATTSHDVRTPLNILQGVHDYIQGVCGNMPSVRKMVQVARNCTRGMLFYLEGLSFLHQVETNKLRVNLVRFNICDVVNNSVKAVEESVELKKLSISAKCDSAVPALVISDQQKFELMLQQLLDNAIKYTFTGKILVTLDYDPKASIVKICVIDTGIGIPESNKNYLFKLFSKLNNESEECLNPQGLGLGLYLCKTLAEALGGTAWVDSKENEGTTACFTIQNQSAEERGYLSDVPTNRFQTINSSSPSLTMNSGQIVDTSMQIHKIEVESLSKTMKLEEVKVVPSSKPKSNCLCNKILIVDDEPLNVLVLESYLKSINLPVDKASNGQIALDMIKDRNANNICCQGYDLVLMDINMPVLDGVETTREIMRMINKKEIPILKVIAITAAAMLENKDIFDQYSEIGFTHICKFICLII